jgi:hypothetical protein
MAQGGLVAACVVLMATGCGPEDGDGSASEGGGEGGSEAGGSEAGGTEGGTSAATQASASADEGGNESAEDCEDANEGAACSTPGEVCSNGDDCGSWTYECQSGTWVQIDGSGCGADPVACSETPVEGDGCGENWGEVCDPDGDCLDVLECDSYEWRFHEVCTEVYCAEAAPEQAKACDDPGRFCEAEHVCGERTYRCFGDYWEFFAGALCEAPQPCSAVPVTNDACDTEGEVCEPPAEGFPTLVCVDGKWDNQ